MTRPSAIDIVYLWVDGKDPAWRLKRERAAAVLQTPERVRTIAPHGDVEGRFRDNDELRYSLRALEAHFPGHGHVYVVTDAQVPAWLRPGSGLTIIDHRDLMPAAALPTFDSGNIESYIHRIPTLSERYFYFNDDVFFGAPVTPADWFWDGGVYAAWSDEPAVSDAPLQPDAPSQVNACRRAIQWLEASRLAAPGATPALAALHCGGDAHTFRTFAHAPRPMLRSLLFELEGIAPELFNAVRSTVFRRWDKPAIVSDFVMRWALAHGRARMRNYRHLYVESGKAERAALARLASAAGQLDFFCVNDTTDDAQAHDPRLAQVRAQLQQMFPRPSRFEANVADAAAWLRQYPWAAGATSRPAERSEAGVG